MTSCPFSPSTVGVEKDWGRGQGSFTHVPRFPCVHPLSTSGGYSPSCPLSSRPSLRSPVTTTPQSLTYPSSNSGTPHFLTFPCYPHRDYIRSRPPRHHCTGRGWEEWREAAEVSFGHPGPTPRDRRPRTVRLHYSPHSYLRRIGFDYPPVPTNAPLPEETPQTKRADLRVG